MHKNSKQFERAGRSWSFVPMIGFLFHLFCVLFNTQKKGEAFFESANHPRNTG